MKRLVAILLSVLLLISLAACTMGTDGTTLNQETTTEDATQAPKVDIGKYEKDFDGMQKYFMDMELISDDEDDKTEMQADVIGATQGVRYKTDTTNFVEFYEFDTDNLSDEAQALIDGIADGGTYTVLGIEDVKGEISGSKKFVMLYLASSTYDFSELTEELKNF